VLVCALAVGGARRSRRRRTRRALFRGDGLLRRGRLPGLLGRPRRAGAQRLSADAGAPRDPGGRAGVHRPIRSSGSGWSTIPRMRHRTTSSSGSSGARSSTRSSGMPSIATVRRWHRSRRRMGRRSSRQPVIMSRLISIPTGRRMAAWRNLVIPWRRSSSGLSRARGAGAYNTSSAGGWRRIQRMRPPTTSSWGNSG